MKLQRKVATLLLASVAITHTSFTTSFATKHKPTLAEIEAAKKSAALETIAADAASAR